MKNWIKNLGISLGLVGILASGCSKRDLPEPKPEYFACEEDRSRVIIKSNYNTHYGHEFYAFDVDCDGKIDALNAVGHAVYVAKGYEENKKISKHENVQELTPKMREMATKLSELNSELAFEIAKDGYTKQQAKKEKK